MIKGYPDGSDITIINAEYNRASKDEETGKWDKDYMDIIFRDNLTGLKHREVIKEPKFMFYELNKDVYIPTGDNGEIVYPPYMEIKNLHPVICKYKDLKATLAELLGYTEWYYENIKNGTPRNNDMLHVTNKIYRSDMNIEDYYRYEFDKRYTNSIDLPLKKAYLDIEVDGINMLGDFPTPEDSPINAITFIYQPTKQSYTFLLRDPSNPLCKEFEDSLKEPGAFDNIKSFIIDHLGGYKKATRLDVIDLNYNFFFYDSEIQMLYELFKLINTLQPDFVLAWNMAFDIPFIIDRIKVLGYNPLDIMAHPDFKDVKKLFYYIDEKNKVEPAERGDFAKIPGYTIYLDQLIQFASRRKGQHAAKSNKLDDIAEAVAKINKYDYHDICPDIIKLPRVNYRIFVLYNIIDVIAQVCIEKNTGDIDFVFNKAISTNTRFSKVHRQTVYLYNKAAKEYELGGRIIGNNINKFNKKPDRKFKGAFVADYRLNDDSLKKTINGFPIDVYDNADDFDYARLYPSTIHENNMATENQIGKIFIPKPLHDKDNRFGDPRFDRGGSFIEDFQPHMWLEFCERWLHLAGYADLVDDVREYFDTIGSISAPMDYRWVNHIPLIKPFVKVNEVLPKGFIKVEGFDKPFIKYKEPNFAKIKAEYLAKKIENDGRVY